VPPRTRAITSTSPAGRRPKVAGLRSPGRSGVTDSSPDPSGPDVERLDEHDLVPAGDTATEAPEHDAADAGRADETDRDETARDETAQSVAATERPAPASKARRGGAMSASATPASTTRADGGARSGTALLERPARAPREDAPRKTGPAPRRGRVAGVLGGAAAPFRRLGGNPRLLQGVLGAVIVVCLVVAGLAFWQGRQAWTQGPVANQAVVDAGATAEVVGQTRQGMEQMLSYDYTKLDDSVNAARADSTGAFQSQYLAVFEQTIRGPATQQKLRQTASVLNIGVKQLSGDHATLMALVQFTAERTTNQQTTNAPGLLNVDVVRQDGHWKISALNPM
jgi:Mce-associated membrane protein